jgi:succinoglycan biosynthesis protein ExoA
VTSVGPVALPPLDASRATVCVVLPMRNEVRWVRTTLSSVMDQTFDPSRVDVVVVDGMSDDGTRQLLTELQQSYPRLRVLDNPRRTTPTSLNLGIGCSTAQVIVRVDGHCRIEPDYIAQCVDRLAATGAGNVGGLMRPEAVTFLGQAVARAMTSRVGIGNARFHYLERETYVDTVYLGAFRREVLDVVGGFDDSLTRNQDDELNYRIREAGYSILLSPLIRSTYVPRQTLDGLWRQFYEYGWWKVRVIYKHPRSLQVRHLAPPILVGSVATSVGLSAVTRRSVFLTPVVLYLSGLIIAALVTARRSYRLAPALVAVFACLHFSYGAGFLAGLVRLAASVFRSPSGLSDLPQGGEQE